MGFLTDEEGRGGRRGLLHVLTHPFQSYRAVGGYYAGMRSRQGRAGMPLLNHVAAGALDGST